jgi:hypothetical protein
MLLKLLQVAAELGLAQKTIRALMKCSGVRNVRLRRHWRVDSDELVHPE